MFNLIRPTFVLWQKLIFRMYILLNIFIYTLRTVCYEDGYIIRFGKIRFTAIDAGIILGHVGDDQGTPKTMFSDLTSVSRLIVDDWTIVEPKHKEKCLSRVLYVAIQLQGRSPRHVLGLPASNHSSCLCQ